jgi:hypothetical protein
MALRSMLFVPADSERKLAKGLGSPADALILDLEDAVAPARKAAARGSATAFIAEHAARLQTQLYVRINPLDSGLAMQDLAAVVVPGLAGIMLPKTHSADDIRRVAFCLDALEARAGIAPGTVRIVPVGHRNRAGHAHHGQLHARRAAARRHHLGRRRPVGGHRRHFEPRRGRQPVAAVHAGQLDVPVRRGRRGRAGHRHALHRLPRRGRPRCFVRRVAPPRLCRPHRHPPRPGRGDQRGLLSRARPNWPTRAAWSRPSRPSPTRAPSASTARCSTCPI